MRYEIHSFIFAEENPTFNQIGGLAVRKSSDNFFTSICGDRLIVVDGPVVKVWNFVTDEWAAWQTVVFPHQVNPFSFFFHLFSIWLNLIHDF